MIKSCSLGHSIDNEYMSHQRTTFYLEKKEQLVYDRSSGVKSWNLSNNVTCCILKRAKVILQLEKQTELQGIIQLYIMTLNQSRNQ